MRARVRAVDKTADDKEIRHRRDFSEVQQFDLLSFFARANLMIFFADVLVSFFATIPPECGLLILVLLASNYYMGHQNAHNIQHQHRNGQQQL